jgi:hypothetical protein
MAGGFLRIEPGAQDSPPGGGLDKDSAVLDETKRIAFGFIGWTGVFKFAGSIDFEVDESAPADST